MSDIRKTIHKFCGERGVFIDTARKLLESNNRIKGWSYHGVISQYPRQELLSNEYYMLQQMKSFSELRQKFLTNKDVREDS